MPENGNGFLVLTKRLLAVGFVPSALLMSSGGQPRCTVKHVYLDSPTFQPLEGMDDMLKAQQMQMSEEAEPHLESARTRYV